eukprot:c22197_g1_i1.p1 GENE.c22197_g1_i1~~c22197_g1_i1.p1  ORF type:complete len:162 (-),score=73.58 c22197_g1_i1:41-526(-)
MFRLIEVLLVVIVVLSFVSCENKNVKTHLQPTTGTRPAAPYDMSGFSLPVVRSFLDDTNQIQSDSQSNSAKTSDDDRTMKSILPLMMMMSQRKHAYHGMGYMGGVYGLGPSSSLGMNSPYAYGGQAAMSYPLQQAHLMNSNPFLDPSRNPFTSFNPYGMMV